MDFILFLPILIFSVIAHEFAHGYTAYICGDDTAYLLGRLNFNPLKHFDLVGTIIVPLALYLLNAPMFGWAKPVPVNYYRLRGGRRDIALVSLAGPMTNFGLMIIAAVLLKIIFLFNLPVWPVAARVLFYAVIINMVLAFFNLLPIPPLDGSKILAYFLPAPAADKYLKYERYGFYILIFLMLTGLFGKIINPLFSLIFNLIFTLIGVPYGAY